MIIDVKGEVYSRCSMMVASVFIYEQSYKLSGLFCLLLCVCLFLKSCPPRTYPLTQGT